MPVSRWLQAQPRWRLFLLTWAIQLITYAAAAIGAVVWSDAYFRMSFRLPPAWFLAGLVPAAALPAAFTVRQLRRGWRSGSRQAA
jgi:hypothetical protein